MLEKRQIPSPPLGMTGWPWETRDENQAWARSQDKALPIITVVTPSYNQGQFLEATLRSVLLQNYPNLEYLVFDGGSSDNSVGIIKKYEAYLDYWHSENDGGQADAIATGFDHATGCIYCWLNSDDIFLPDALWFVADFFNRNPKIDVVYSNRLVISEEGIVIGRHVWPFFFSKYHWALGQPLAQECCFWRAELYQKVGGIDRSKFFIMDYDLFYRMWRVGKFRKTMACLGCFRVHDESKNSKHQQIWQRELSQAKADYQLIEPGYFTLRLIKRLDYLQNLLEIVMEGLRVSKIQSWYKSECGLILFRPIV
jgi:glycosyltransferase involved in cell wall biosynthesis